MNKQEQIKKLNSEILFHSRKNFGMFGNIQWDVEDIVDGTLIVRVSSSTKGWSEVQPNGRRLPSKEQIANNIKASVEREVLDMKVQVSWQEWMPEDGKGFIMSVHGKAPEEAANQIWKLLHGDEDQNKSKK